MAALQGRQPRHDENYLMDVIHDLHAASYGTCCDRRVHAAPNVGR